LVKEEMNSPFEGRSDERNSEARDHEYGKECFVGFIE
jgi:hypothetical protein